MFTKCLFFVHRDRWGDAAIDDYLPNLDKVSAQYSAPSTRANSETSLRSLSRSRDRVDFTQLKPGIKVPRETKYVAKDRHETQPLHHERHHHSSTNGNQNRSNAVIKELLDRKLIINNTSV